MLNPSWLCGFEYVQLVWTVPKLLLLHCCLPVSFSNCVGVCGDRGDDIDWKKTVQKRHRIQCSKSGKPLLGWKNAQNEEKKFLQPISSLHHIGSDFALVQINSKFPNTTLEKAGLAYFTNSFTLKMYHSLPFPICFKLNYSAMNDSSGKANELSLKAAQRALAFSSALRHIYSLSSVSLVLSQGLSTLY